MAEQAGRGRGRPPGAKNKRTKALEQQAAEAAAKIQEALGDGVFEGDAHALLMAVYKNPANELPIRVDAAKAAIRYEKPSLAAIDVGNKDGKPFETQTYGWAPTPEEAIPDPSRE